MSSLEKEVKLKYKICIFGDAAVGKTTLTHRYLTGIFKERYQTSIGMDMFLKKLEIDDKRISLQIWDFAGEERFRFLMPGCVKGANGAIFMYDITRYKTLKNLKDWIYLFKDTNKKEGQVVPMILIGSKMDLKEFRVIPEEDGRAFATEMGFLDFMECSSKKGINVEGIFENLTRIIMKKYG